MTRIFLASSKELESDRRAFEQEIHRRNQLWGRRGYEFHIDVWEDFDDSMSPSRKQDDYNAAILNADLFVLLIGTKLGKYSREEFELAWAQFLKTSHMGKRQHPGKPRIYTYFKAMPEYGEADPGPEYATVREFLNRLAELGHWPNKYDDISQLLHHFGTQLERLWVDEVIEPSSKGGQGPPHEKVVQVSQGARTANVEHNKGSIVTGQLEISSGGGAVVFGAVKADAGFTGRDSIGGASRKRKSPKKRQ